MDISTKNTILGVSLSAIFAVLVSSASSYLIINVNQAVMTEKLNTMEAQSTKQEQTDKEILKLYQGLAKDVAVRDQILSTVVESVQELTESSKKLTSMVDRIDERMNLQETFQLRREK